jgi:hypothetical protein
MKNCNQSDDHLLIQGILYVILPCVWALTAGNGTTIFPSMNTGIIQTPYKLKDPLHFLQLPCFYIWTPYQASLRYVKKKRYAYKVGRSYPPGIFLRHSLIL